MISPETLRQYPFFTQLNEEQIKCLVDVSHEETAEAGDFLFHSDDDLIHFYMVIEGEFEIIFEVPKLEVDYENLGQPSRLKIENVVFSKVSPGDILGWSGLVSPFKATSGCRAKSSSKIIAFNCKKLLQCFENDCQFGFYMIQTAAQVIGKRLHAIYKGG